MDTTIGVNAGTRDRLSALKRELGVKSIDEALQQLLDERGELRQRRRSDRLLQTLARKRSAVAALCKEHHIKRLAVFGSALHGDARPDSDLDLLVEFEEGDVPSGYRFVDIEMAFEALLDAKVDLNTPQDLSPHFREQVLAEAQVAYGAA